MKKATTRYHIENKQQRKVHAEEKRLALMTRAAQGQCIPPHSPESMTQKDLDRQARGSGAAGTAGLTPMIGMRWRAL